MFATVKSNLRAKAFILPREPSIVLYDWVLFPEEDVPEK